MKITRFFAVVVSLLVYSFYSVSVVLAENVGDVIQVPITVTASENVVAADFTVSVTSNGTIQNVSCGGGGLNQDFGSSGNRCVIADINSSDGLGTQNGQLATVTVRADSAGTLTVSASGDLSNGSGQPASGASLQGGSFTINGSGPTNTPQPTATNTPRPTATNTPQPTATNIPQPTATNSPTPTGTQGVRYVVFTAGEKVNAADFTVSISGGSIVNVDCGYGNYQEVSGSGNNCAVADFSSGGAIQGTLATVSFSPGSAVPSVSGILANQGVEANNSNIYISNSPLATITPTPPPGATSTPTPTKTPTPTRTPTPPPGSTNTPTPPPGSTNTPTPGANNNNNSSNPTNTPTPTKGIIRRVTPTRVPVKNAPTIGPVASSIDEESIKELDEDKITIISQSGSRRVGGPPAINIQTSDKEVVFGAKSLDSQGVDITFSEHEQPIVFNFSQLPKLSDQSRAYYLPSRLSFNYPYGGSHVTVEIPEKTMIGAVSDLEGSFIEYKSWDGIMSGLHLLPERSVPLSVGTVDFAISIGLDEESLLFDKPVKITIPGQAGKKVGYIAQKKVSPINKECTKEELANEYERIQECYFYNGSDLEIYVRHFTIFFTYEPFTSNSGLEDSIESGLRAPYVWIIVGVAAVGILGAGGYLLRNRIFGGPPSSGF